MRGCLHSYARYLGLDPGQIVRDYARHYERPGPSSIERLDKEVRIAKKPPRPKWLVAAVASSVLLAAAAVAGVLGGGNGSRSEVARQIPSLPSRHAGPPAASRQAPAPRVSVTIEARRPTLVAVLRDGRKVFEEEMQPGDVRTFLGRRTIEVVAANAAAVRLTVNGEEIGVAGEPGSVYRARFGPRGRLAD